MSTGAGGESTRWWMQPTQDLFTLQIGFVLDLPIWISPTTSTQPHPSWLFLFCRCRISSGIVENRWFGIFLSKQVQGKPEASGFVKITNFCLKVFLVNAFVYLCFYICIFVSDLCILLYSGEYWAAAEASVDLFDEVQIGFATNTAATAGSQT